MCFLHYDLKLNTARHAVLNDQHFHFSSGHGMIIDGGINVDAHWGRKLMATVQNNETLKKNCTEPGRRWQFIITVMANIHKILEKWSTSLSLSNAGVSISLWYKNNFWTPLTCQSLLKSASWRDYTIKILSARSQDYLHSFLRVVLFCFLLLYGACLWCTDNMT